MEDGIQADDPAPIQTVIVYDMTTVPFPPPAEDEMLLVSHGPAGIEVVRLKETTA